MTRTRRHTIVVIDLARTVALLMDALTLALRATRVTALNSQSRIPRKPVGRQLCLSHKGLAGLFQLAVKREPGTRDEDADGGVFVGHRSVSIRYGRHAEAYPEPRGNHAPQDLRARRLHFKVPPSAPSWRFP